MAFRLRISVVVFTVVLLSALVPASVVADGGLLDAAVQAAGGTEALADLQTFEATASGVRWTVDEGPFAGSGAAAPGPYASTTTVDVAADQQRIDTELVSYFVFARTLTEVVTPDGGFVDGQDNNFAPPFAAPMLSDRWMSTRLHLRLLYPHLLFIDAAADPNSVTTVGDTLVFDTGGAPLYIEIDPDTGHPATASTVESDPLRRDVPVVVTYGKWTYVDGVAFPMRVRVEYDGELVQREVRSAVDVNPGLDPGLFAFPDGITPVFDADLAHRGVVRHQMIQSFAAIGFPRDGVQPFVTGTELAPGVWFLAGGSHNSLAIEHDDGVTIVETPLDEVRTAGIQDWVASNLGTPITRAIVSHHHTDHSSGLRQFVAAGAEAVVHESAARFFLSVFQAGSDLVPDGMENLGSRPVISTVPDGGSLEIADSTNPIGVHTLESEHAADLVLVDAGGVLFVVDIFNPGLPVTPEADPILPRVLDLGLAIDLVAGGHGGVITWDEFVALFE